MLPSAMLAGGLCSGSADARSGRIVVEREISLQVTRVARGIARYEGPLTIGQSIVQRVATTRHGRASPRVRRRAARVAHAYCIERVRIDTEDSRAAEVVTVTYLAEPPFQTGHRETLPDPGDDAGGYYSITGPAPPPGATVRAEVERDLTRRTVGRFRWRVVCAGARTVERMP